MADINIERKGNSVWPWVVGILLLAVVVFVVLQYLNKRNDGDVVGAPTDSTAVQQAPQYQPAPPPSSTDTLTGDSAKVDSIKGTTTSSQ